MEIGIAILVIINITCVAFGYGKLTQKVMGLCQRTNDITHRLDKIEEVLRK